MKTLYLIALAGVVFHLIMKYRDAYTRSEAFDFKKQGIFSVFSLITALLLVYFREGIADFLSMQVDWSSKVSQLLVFFLGYFSDSIWKNVESTGKGRLGVKEDSEQKIIQPENPPKP